MLRGKVQQGICFITECVCLGIMVSPLECLLVNSNLPGLLSHLVLVFHLDADLMIIFIFLKLLMQKMCRNHHFQHFEIQIEIVI